MITYKYNKDTVVPFFSAYTSDINKLALAFEDKFHNPYGVVTVNLINEKLTNRNCAFLDTNNYDDIVEWLVENNFGKLTGKKGYSGYCEYPEFEFSGEIIKKLCGNNLESFESYNNNEPDYEDNLFFDPIV